MNLQYINNKGFAVDILGNKCPMSALDESHILLYYYYYSRYAYKVVDSNYVFSFFFRLDTN